MDEELPIRKTQRMHYGRVSKPGARYFLTFCTEGRRGVLCSPDVSRVVFEQLESQQDDGDFELSCATLMPDHLHVVFRLGYRLSLGRLVSKFKSKSGDLVSWQGDFFDHRLREDESEGEYGFYVFMNPYVEGLVALDSRYPHWKRWRSAPYRFEELLDRKGVVPSQWVNLATSFFEG